jgi:Flp pilus assembly protein TadG
MWRQLLQRFRVADHGNVALTFTLTLIPVIGAIGVAVDYSRANSARTAMQMAIDSTALMLSKDAQTLTAAQLSAKADSYFTAMLNRPEITNVVLTPSYSSPSQGNFKLELTADAKVATTFSKVLGQEIMNLNVRAEVQWGIRKLEVALALDNTGSMATNNKMTNLKTAAKNLIDTLKKAAKNPGDVKIAIIPFDTTVNLGTSYKDNLWFDVSCSAMSAPNGCNANNWKNYWEGCVRDRTYPFDTQDDAPSIANTATLYPVFDCGSLTTLMPLTYDWTALNTKVDAMTPNGNTNVTIGLVWAWHALTAQAPLPEAAAPAPDLDKVIILLTDGDNTRAWKNSNDTEVTSQNTIDGRTALVCANIKAAGIKLYTIRVIDGNASLLQNCASKPSMYYDVQQASQLNSVFGGIAEQLANLRIAK